MAGADRAGAGLHVVSPVAQRFESASLDPPRRRAPAARASPDVAPLARPRRAKTAGVATATPGLASTANSGGKPQLRPELLAERRSSSAPAARGRPERRRRSPAPPPTVGDRRLPGRFRAPARAAPPPHPTSRRQDRPPPADSCADGTGRGAVRGTRSRSSRAARRTRLSAGAPAAAAVGPSTLSDKASRLARRTASRHSRRRRRRCRDRASRPRAAPEYAASG